MSLRSAARRLLRRVLHTRGRDGAIELMRLQNLPRYQKAKTGLLGFMLDIPDGPSFAAMWQELFQNEIYKFASVADDPRILDCGANIGLSCIYFKRLYPRSRITAFEPDPKILGYLRRALSAARLEDVEVVPKAVWTLDGSLDFVSEGADAGRLDPSANSAIRVDTVRLKDFLDEPIDFLKIDIEGAETEVLIDCGSALMRVRRLFVEYHSFVGRPQQLHRLLAVLAEVGFRVQVQPMLTSARPYMEVNENLGMDLQLNVFAYRP
jgi:FkbM family methyltransferase